MDHTDCLTENFKKWSKKPLLFCYSGKGVYLLYNSAWESLMRSAPEARDLVNSDGDLLPSTATTVKNRDVESKEYHNFYITIPWSPQVYFTVRGAENFHIYLWIAKDFCWTQQYEFAGMFFGAFAMVWVAVLGYHAIKNKNLEEMYMLVALTLWLFGNYWWMAGELVNGDDDVRLPQTGHIFEAALGWLLIYYVILKPRGYIKPTDDMVRKYQEASLHSRFKFFTTWRQYEHFHTFCWLGKDWSWNQLDPYTWAIFMVPTLLIAIDFIYCTWASKKMTIDCMHYIAQLMWVLGNLLWAVGELFFPTYDAPYQFYHPSKHALQTGRWYSGWCLLFSYIPILILYMIWLPLTCMGTIKAANIPENDRILARLHHPQYADTSPENAVTSELYVSATTQEKAAEGV